MDWHSFNSENFQIEVRIVTAYPLHSADLTLSDFTLRRSRRSAPKQICGSLETQMRNKKAIIIS